MEFGYLEIVTTDPAAVCATYEATYGVTFSGQIAELGGARVVVLPNGGRLGVRGQMRPDETPVVRPYVLVDDVAAALDTAEKNGAEIAVPAMELPGQGVIGIFLQNGVESGVWQRA